MAYDYSKLVGRIVEKFDTQAKFSGALGLSERSLSLKLNNVRGFKQDEILKAAQLLELGDDDIPIYFFALKVQ